MNFEIPGTLYEIFSEQQVSDRFRKREFVLEVPDGSFTQYVKFQLTQDKCSVLDQYQTGDEVKVSFNIQGKRFPKNGETLYFTNLQAWRIERQGEGGDRAAGGGYEANTGSSFTVARDEPEDLPF